MRCICGTSVLPLELHAVSVQSCVPRSISRRVWNAYPHSNLSRSKPLLETLRPAEDLLFLVPLWIHRIRAREAAQQAGADVRDADSEDLPVGIKAILLRHRQ